ncbi:MAG: hypothetical protein P8090_19005 [Gammaproteobacteria bacterium]
MKPVTWRLARCAALGLLIVTGSARANGTSMLFFTFVNFNIGYHWSDTTPHVKLARGETHRYRFCATAYVVKKAHQKTRPGAPLGVTLHWTRVVTGSRVVTSLRAGRLPGHTTMTGPTSDGRYCSTALVARYADFPANGTWTLHATVDGIDPTKLASALDWDVLPRKFNGPHHGVIVTPRSPIRYGGTHVRRNGQRRQTAPRNHLKVPVVHSRSSEKSKKQREGGFVPRPYYQEK